MAKSFINDSTVRIGYQLDTNKYMDLSNGKTCTLVLAIDIGELVGDMVFGYTGNISTQKI